MEPGERQITTLSPRWLADLRTLPEPPWRWLSPAEPGAGQSLSPKAQPVAEVVLVPETAPSQLGTVKLFFDADAPTQLYAALSETQPPELWIPVGNSVESVTAALRPYRLANQKAPPRLQLARTVRGFIGHTESLDQTYADLQRQLAAHPALAPGSWGSAYADDPWPRPLPVDLPPSTRNLLGQRYGAQSPDRPRTLTFTTRWSRSLVSLEDHHGALVLAIAYTPISGVVSSRQSELPADLPSDARWAALALPFAGAATLTEWLWSTSPPPAALGDRVTSLLGLAAVWHDDLRLLELLRRIGQHSADWALRAAGIVVAQRQGYQLLLHELCAGENDPELRAELESRTAFAEPSPSEAAP